MLTVTLYMRSDCHLCEQAAADLNTLQTDFPHTLVQVDVDTDPDLKRVYGFNVPVVEVGPYKLQAPMTIQDLRMTLGAAVDRRQQLERVDDQAYRAAVERSQELTAADRISYWFSRHYLLVFNLFLLLYVGLPFLAPVFMKAGLEPAANVIHSIYRPLCHQWGFRSWFLFGEQAYYPHETAHIDEMISFEEISGISDQNDPTRTSAREYIGDTHAGYKIALCQRDVAIWGAMLLFGVIFAVTGRRIPPLHWILWIVIGLVPVGLDGFSQVFSQLQLDWINQFLSYRESTPFLRTLTGFLFGFSTAWFGFPVVEEVMRDTRMFFMKKIAILNKG